MWHSAWNSPARYNRHALLKTIQFVASYLTVRDLILLRRVCRSLNEASQDPLLWERQVIEPDDSWGGLKQMLATLFKLPALPSLTVRYPQLLHTLAQAHRDVLVLVKSLHVYCKSEPPEGVDTQLIQSLASIQLHGVRLHVVHLKSVTLQPQLMDLLTRFLTLEQLTFHGCHWSQVSAGRLALTLPKLSPMVQIHMRLVDIDKHWTRLEAPDEIAQTCIQNAHHLQSLSVPLMHTKTFFDACATALENDSLSVSKLKILHLSLGYPASSLDNKWRTDYRISLTDSILQLLQNLLTRHPNLTEVRLSMGATKPWMMSDKLYHTLTGMRQLQFLELRGLRAVGHNFRVLPLTITVKSLGVR